MNPDLLLCQTRSTCSECRWSGPRGCVLLDAVERAVPTLRAPPASSFGWSDAGLVYDDPASRASA